MLEPVVHGDQRGFFVEFYSQRTFSDLGIDRRFVQDNHSRSQARVLRGLHYQLERPQAKLVRVISGEVYDVAVDVRRGSPTFGKWVGAVLSADNRLMMFVPEGFAHGFYVMSDGAEFLYKVSDFYAPEAERGIAWNDPDLAVEWPVPKGVEPILSDRDRSFGPLRTRPSGDLPLYGGPAV